MVLSGTSLTIQYLLDTNLDSFSIFQVLKSVPWDQVDIEVIVTELVHSGEVFLGSRMDVIRYLESRNFIFVGNMFDDFFIRKDLLGSKYVIDYEAARSSFPLFSQEKDIDSRSIMNKFGIHGFDMEYSENSDGICMWNENWNFLAFLQSF